MTIMITRHCPVVYTHSREVHNPEATPCLLPEGEEVCMGSHCVVYGCAAGEHPWRRGGTLENEQVDVFSWHAYRTMYR